MTTYIYNKQSNSIKQKATMEKPSQPLSQDYGFHNHSLYCKHLNKYFSDADAYNQHIASLKEYPCSEDCKNIWEDGKEIQDFKDFRLCFYNKHAQDGNTLLIKDALIASPIHKELKEDEDKLWDELFEKLYHDCDMEALTYTTDTMIEKLKQVFSIKRKRAHNQYWKR